jgi:ribonuclease VapC
VKYSFKPPPVSFIAQRGIAYALDSSALLAYLFDEKGGERVIEVMDRSVISALNWAEVIQKHDERGLTPATLLGEFRGLGLLILPFDSVDAEETAALQPLTRGQGLSLADRACIALARRWDLTALTADRIWRELALDLKIEVIR